MSCINSYLYLWLNNVDFSFDLIQNREWYGYHFPELVKIIPDNHMYAKVVKIVKNRKELTDELLEQLEECVMDSAKAKAIIDASKSSMGLIFMFLNLYYLIKNFNFN